MARTMTSLKLCLLVLPFAAIEANKVRKVQAVEPFKKGFRQVLHNHHDMQYFADFKIGGQEISGIFDTGSFEIVVRSSRCGACVHPTLPYSHELSATFESNGTLTQHVYGSGPCTTMLGFDTVQVGPYLIAKRQPIWEIVEHQIPILNKAKFAAIVGIGPKYGYNSQARTLLMNYHVDEFSICLKKGAGDDGYLTWGPDDDDGMKEGEVVEAKVYGKHHWATNMTAMTFKANVSAQNKTIDVCRAGCGAIIDSGTSLIAGPTAALLELSEQLGTIEEDCSNLHELPSLRFMLDGKEFELPPQAYVMRIKGANLEADNIWDLLFFKPKVRKVDTCMPAFMELDMTTQLGDVWILGMPFFRYFHTTFDRERQIMRFAKAGDDCEPKPLTSSNDDAASEDAVGLAAAGADASAAYKPMDVDPSVLMGPRISWQNDDKLKTITEI
eukprot:gb/GFBE01019212.1/.p1 GENE.gb/GFBE01019212.1/~~gb/GFBE01019212.1/.p1  ORF type:complete len:441 (+),score=122.25 gb/GFBE01019212.1/:1-1323(+)